MVLDLGEGKRPHDPVRAQQRVDSLADGLNVATDDDLLQLVPAPGGQQLSAETDAEDPRIRFQQSLPRTFGPTCQVLLVVERGVVLQPRPHRLHDLAAVLQRDDVPSVDVALDEGTEPRWVLGVGAAHCDWVGGEVAQQLVVDIDGAVAVSRN